MLRGYYNNTKIQVFSRRSVRVKVSFALPKYWAKTNINLSIIDNCPISLVFDYFKVLFYTGDPGLYQDPAIQIVLASLACFRFPDSRVSVPFSLSPPPPPCQLFACLSLSRLPHYLRAWNGLLQAFTGR